MYYQNNLSEMVMDDITITEDDLIEADLSSNSFDDIFVRVDSFPEMKNTVWLKQLDIYPINSTEMTFFTTQLDILGLFKNARIKIEELGPIRLDAYYLILKSINIESVKFCEYLFKNFFVENITCLFKKYLSDDKMAQVDYLYFLIFIEEFSTSMGHYGIRFLTLYQEFIHQDYAEPVITQRFIRYCNRMLNTTYYSNILTCLDLDMPEDILQKNQDIFESMIQQMVAYTRETGIIILEVLNDMVNKFMDMDISDQEIIDHISTNIDIKMLVKRKSDAIKYFIQLFRENDNCDISNHNILDISEYDNFLYPLDRKKYNQREAIWSESHFNFDNYSNGLEKKINSIGMKIYEQSTDILPFFISHNFFRNESEPIDLIIMIMETCRYELYMSNKYDEMNLETLFSLITTSDDTYNTYESFLLYLKRKKALPINYPIEFILRVLSRALNVIIYFYNNEIMFNIIDNTLYKIYQNPIHIYRQDSLSYYLLCSYNENFVPLCNNTNNFQLVYMLSRNKKIKIIEV